jgi:hypothetical protein
MVTDSGDSGDSGDNGDSCNGGQLPPDNCPMHLTTDILLSHWDPYDQVSEYQNGFRSGRCAADNAFILTQLIQEIHQSRKSRAYIAFIDFRKAFDSVDIPTLLQKLRQKGVNDNMLSVIKSMYSKSQSAIRHRGRLGDFFKVGKGVAQGCILSPLLFSIYIDDLLIEIAQLRRSSNTRNRMLENNLASSMA